MTWSRIFQSQILFLLTPKNKFNFSSIAKIYLKWYYRVQFSEYRQSSLITIDPSSSNTKNDYVYRNKQPSHCIFLCISFLLPWLLYLLVLVSTKLILFSPFFQSLFCRYPIPECHSMYNTISCTDNNVICQEFQERPPCVFSRPWSWFWWLGWKLSSDNCMLPSLQQFSTISKEGEKREREQEPEITQPVSARTHQFQVMFLQHTCHKWVPAVSMETREAPLTDPTSIF